jgi:hypothetical protein
VERAKVYLDGKEMDRAALHAEWTGARPRPNEEFVRMKGAGGTSGGIGMFFAGAAMVIAGGYLLLTRVSVMSGGWLFYGYNAFGLSLFPLLIGIGMLFYNSQSLAGWLLTGGGTLIIFVGLVANLHIYFQPTSLFDTLMMLGLLAGGIGLVGGSLRDIQVADSDSGK